MTPSGIETNRTRRPKGVRWWPGGAILFCAAGTIVWIRLHADWAFQERNLKTLGAGAIMLLLLALWWLFFSRAPWRPRLAVAGALAVAIGLMAGLFRIRGVSGDLIPVLEPRWAKSSSLAPAGRVTTPPSIAVPAASHDFPQFLGPDRTAQLDGPALNEDWAGSPPRVLWRQPVGPAWSGWALVGGYALTQEQRPEGECVTCYEAGSGRLLWAHADPAYYHTTLAGAGPRCTPTVMSNRVFTLGALGNLNCLELPTGRLCWSNNIAADAQATPPEWGYSGSPLVVGGLVIVSAGGGEPRSVLAYRSDSGHLAWSSGGMSATYSSPIFANLAGVNQILAFHSRGLAALAPDTGAVLWQHRFGNGQPQVAQPMVVGANRVLIGSGYGVGSALLEIAPGADGHPAARRLWETRKLKPKFANLVQRQGYVYGLDDGILVCLDLRDGSQRWKEGRYGHGQGLLVRDLYLLMAESGELVLLKPAPDGPHELHRFPVFNAKTWNPIALGGDLLLVRNDLEAAALNLPLAPASRDNARTNSAPSRAAAVSDRL